MPLLGNLQLVSSKVKQQTAVVQQLQAVTDKVADTGSCVTWRACCHSNLKRLSCRPFSVSVASIHAGLAQCLPEVCA